MNRNKHLYHIDALFIILSVLFVYYNLLHDSLPKAVGAGEGSLYLALQSLSDNAGLAADCLIVLAGFSLYQDYLRRPERTLIPFALGQVLLLWPALAVSAAGCVLLKEQRLYPAARDLLFLRGTGLSMGNEGILWFVGPLFWCSLLLFLLLKVLGKKDVLPVIGVLTLFGYLVNLNNSDGELGISVVYGFLSLAMCRVFADLGVGCLIGMLREGKALEAAENPAEGGAARALADSAAEILLLAFLAAYFLLGFEADQNQLLPIIVFAALLVIMLRGDGALSRLLCRRGAFMLGRASYAVCALEPLLFAVLKKTLWKTSFAGESAAACLVLSLLLCCAAGAVFYLAVQRQLEKWCRKIARERLQGALSGREEMAQEEFLTGILPGLSAWDDPEEPDRENALSAERLALQIRGVVHRFRANLFLFEQLVRRDFQKKYKRTVFGMAWSVLSPLLTLLVMRVVFYNFFGRSTPHYTTYLFCGNIVMGYFREATNNGMSSLMSNAGILTKINVPKYLFLFSKNVAALINFGLTLVVFFIFCVIDGIVFTPRLILLVYPILCLTVLNIGVGMILSALFVFFRDISYLYSVFLTLLTYLSAIFYTLDSFAENVQRLFLFNPVFVYIKYFREIVIQHQIPSLQYHALCAFYALLLLTIGCWMYKKYNKQFIYYM